MSTVEHIMSVCLFEEFVAREKCSTQDIAGISLVLGDQFPEGEESELYCTIWEYITVNHPQALRFRMRPESCEELLDLADHWAHRILFKETSTMH